MVTFVEQVSALETRVDDLAAFVHAFADNLEQPVFSAEESGFRYTAPGARHFCLLRCVRIVSGMYASMALCRAGFTQEIAVVLRTALEFCSQIEYVLASLDSDLHPQGKAAEFVADFFRDSWIAREENEKRIKLHQHEVHDAVGKSLEETIGRDAGEIPMSRLMSRSYMSFSSYVHGRYVECMDLYGGRPGNFHLFGMRNTPKDDENLAVLDTLMVTAEQCFVSLVQKLQMWELLDNCRELAIWYKRILREAK